MTQVPPAVVASAIERQRLVVTFIDAAYKSDAETIAAVLSAIDRHETGPFIAGLAGAVGQAFAAQPLIGWESFIRAYRQAIDVTEARLDDGSKSC